MVVGALSAVLVYAGNRMIARGNLRTKRLEVEAAPYGAVVDRNSALERENRLLNHLVRLWEDREYRWLFWARRHAPDVGTPPKSPDMAELERELWG